MKLYQLEKRKYRGQKVYLILGIYILINLMVSLIHLFSKTGQSLEPHILVLRIFDANAFFKILLMPIVLASLASLSIQLENRHQMWKILQSSGQSFSAIFKTKFRYIFLRYLLAQLIEVSLLLAVIYSRGLGAAISWDRLAFFLFGTCLVSFTILAMHFAFSLIWNNQLISISIALILSLVSIILIYLPFPLMWASPYSWYGYLMMTVPQKVGNTFVFSVRNPEFYPILASLVLGSLLYLFNQRLKVEV